MAGSTETEKREAVRREYAALFATLSKLLFEADPIGINFESNTDEYEPEVGTIIPRLREADSEDDVRRIIHEEFCKWFDEKTAGPVDAYRELAASVWAEWQRYQEPADERRPGALK
jgi:hypothetical protein